MSKGRTGFEIASTTLAPMLAEAGRGTTTWRTAATALSAGAEAEDAWRLLAPQSSAEALALLSVVVAALDATLTEVRRPPADLERRDIKGIIKKSRALQLAIRTSSLPGGFNYGPYELQPAAELPAALDWLPRIVVDPTARAPLPTGEPDPDRDDPRARIQVRAASGAAGLSPVGAGRSRPATSAVRAAP